MSLQDIGILSAIVAGSIATVTILFRIFKYIYHKFKFKNPISVCYLIPQEIYPCYRFKGAPDHQSKPVKLVIGVGKYQIMNEFYNTIDMRVDPFTLHFEGSNRNIPIIESPHNPFFIGFIESAGIKYRKDWWGKFHPYTPDISTNYWYKNNIRHTGHIIVTKGSWKGKACFSIPVHDERIYVIKLDLEVSGKKDQVPFLKL